MATDYDYDQLFPGRFLKAGLFNGKHATLTIADVRLEKLPDSKKKKDVGKGVISFRETELELVLNKTNGECLKGMFGRRTGQWIGRRVTFYPETVKAFGSKKLAIRVLGSPDLPKDAEIQLQLGQEVETVVMKKTQEPKGGGKKAAASKPAQQPSPPAPGRDTLAAGADIEPHDPVTGELSDGPPPHGDSETPFGAP